MKKLTNKIKGFFENKAVRDFASFFRFIVVAFSLFASTCLLFDGGYWFFGLIVLATFAYEVIVFFKRKE